MPMHTVSATEMLRLYLTAVTAAGLADNAAASPIANLFWSLHTANPGVAGTQATSEIAYTGYARQPIARLPAAWSIAANIATPAASIDFPQMTAGAGGVVTFIALGKLVSGAGQILWSGTLTPNITVAVGVTPRITSGTSIKID